MRGARLFALLLFSTVLCQWPHLGIAEGPSSVRSAGCQSQSSRRLPLHVYLPGWYDSEHHWPKLWWGEPHPGARPLATDNSPSQDREDEYAYNNFFYQMQGGSYLEMGGLDGWKFSNTWWFNHELGWHGMLIEPNSEMYPIMVKNRPNDINVHSAVCLQPGKLHWVTADHSQTKAESDETRKNFGAVSGIYEFMPKAILGTHWPHIKSAEGLPEITCLPLASILGKLGITHVNFFSLDVEGAELSVLKSVNFNCFSFDVMCAESNGDLAAIVDLMEGHGYRHHGSALRSEWFVRNGFVPSSRNGTSSSDE